MATSDYWRAHSLIPAWMSSLTILWPPSRKCFMFVSSTSLNAQVLSYLQNRGKSSELIAAPESVRDPYMGQGSHPDIVERVWNKLGAALPTDCRRLVYGTPALVQPESGILLAFCLGTEYCMRLTPARFDEALTLGES